MFFASLDLGVEIPIIKNVLFISPEVNYALGYFKKFTPDFHNQLTFNREKLLSFGIDLKFKL